MHIQFIDTPAGGAYQVRVGQGPGQTRYFSVRKYGGAAEALKAAKKAGKELQQAALPPVPRLSRLLSNNRSGISGIQFQWRPGKTGSFLYVAGNWTDKQGRARAFAYSVERNGLEGALRKAIEIRVKSGAPKPDFELALERLTLAYKTGAKPTATSRRGELRAKRRAPRYEASAL